MDGTRSRCTTAVERRLTIAVDRFGGMPLFWGTSPAGTAFAGGVRGVLMAPGIAREPDPDAIGEAVTFGGFRLGTRTSVRGVQRLPGASLLTVADRVSSRSYWSWPEAHSAAPDPPTGDLVAEARRVWSAPSRHASATRAVPARRCRAAWTAAHPRRAAVQAPSWTALTYGLDRCDDSRYAQRAASVAGATWIFYPLYQGSAPDWLDRRTGYIQQTDGLVQLADLLHCESLHVQASLIDVHLSGYIGDVVCGTTYDDVMDAPTLLSKLPFSGASIGWTWPRAIEWAEGVIAALRPSAPKFAIYDHKFPQAIHPIFQSYSPYMRVRSPFTDYALFDFFHTLSDAARRTLYPEWLATDYPAFFASIPDQRTGVPIGTPPVLLALERLRRGGMREASRLLRASGLPSPRPRVRAYHDEDRRWAAQPLRQRIEQTILRGDSLAAEIFGRDRLAEVLRDFFDRGAGPVQVIGALYTYEAYHRDLAGHLARAAYAAESSVPEVAGAAAR